MRNIEIATDYLETVREVIALANRGMMAVRVEFPDGISLTVHGALNRFGLWKYVNDDERSRSLGVSQ